MNHLDHTSGKVTLLDNETTVIAEITPLVYLAIICRALPGKSYTPAVFRYKQITNLTNVDRKPVGML